MTKRKHSEEPTVEEQIQEAADYIKSKIGTFVPEVVLVLGSGLGDLADTITEGRIAISYGDIPHFGTSTVVGHANRLVFGKLAGVPVMCQQGRFHYYEGHAMDTLVLPLRVGHRLGARGLIVTNAAGGISSTLVPGDIMLITDHVNNMGASPLTGPNVASLGPRFCDMSAAYTPDLVNLAKEVASSRNLSLKEGVYWANAGPQYETPAEIRMAEVSGASAVGMSTVPEVIAASHMSMHVLGMSCITNMAAGKLVGAKLDHSEVTDTANRVKSTFQSLVTAVLPGVAKHLATRSH
jgi:purine-nucleoside phosphorylase